MENSLLFDMVGVLIGFAGIMLVLSMLVTMLTQYVTVALKLRSAVLRKALMGMFTLLLTKAPGGGGTSSNAMHPKLNQFLDDAVKLTDEVLTLDKRGRGETRYTATWLKRHELEVLLDRVNSDLQEKLNRTDFDWAFPRMEAASTQILQRWTTIISFLAALFVAFVFQLSAPELLQRLTEDDAFREAAQAAALSRLAEDTSPLDRPELFAEAHDQALAQIRAEFKELSFDTVDQDPTDYESARASLTAATIGHARQADILRRYEALVLANASDVVRDRIAEESSALAAIHIIPWRDGCRYYWPAGKGPDIARCLGVLASAALLSLGAPFWYNRLSDLASLRDMLAPKPPKKNNASQQDPPE